MKILDSDHCIAILRGRLSVEAYIEPDDTLAITTISIGELMHGAYKSAKPEENVLRVNILISSMQILSFDAMAARQFGQLKARLESQGNKLADLDLQIASMALTQNATLVTHNQRHFARIPDLLLADWLV